MLVRKLIQSTSPVFFPTPGRWVYNEMTRALEKTSAYRNFLPVDEPLACNRVNQGCYSTARYGTAVRYLLTLSLGPCLAVTLYDPSSKTGLLAHSESAYPQKSIANIVRQMESLGAQRTNLETRIVGGMNDFSELVVYRLLRELQDEHIRIKEIDVLGENTRNIALDCLNGEVLDIDIFTIDAEMLSNILDNRSLAE